MNTDNAILRKKLRLLGNILLVLSSLSLIVGLAIIPLTLYFSSPSELPALDNLADELILYEGITEETTVRELLEKDREFFEENRGWHLGLSTLSAVLVIVFALIFLRLALAWRRAEPFGRNTIVGLRCLGVLLVAQFIVGTIAYPFIPRAVHSGLFSLSDYYEDSITYLFDGGPGLSLGILLIILSWVLDYGSQIKEEQSLTI